MALTRENILLDLYELGKLNDQQKEKMEILFERGALKRPDVSVGTLPQILPDRSTQEKIEEPQQDIFQPMTMKSMITSAIGNTPKSAKQFMTDLVTPFMHPAETAKAIGSLGMGLGEKLIPGTQDNEQIVDDLVEVFKDRYGGIENIKKTIADDPVGAMADIASIFVPAGAVTKGIGVASKLEKVGAAGKVISKVGELADPLSLAGKTAKAATRAILPERLPGELYRSAAKFSTIIPEKTRKLLTDTALDNRIMPTMKGLDDLNDKIGSINENISGLIDKATEAGKKIPVNALFTNLKELRKNALLSAEPLTQQRVIANIARQVHKANKKGSFTPEEVQKLKQNIYKETESLYSKATQAPVKGSVKMAVARSAKESLEKLFPEIKELNKREGSLIALKKEIEKSASRISNRDLLGIGVPIKGAYGGVMGGGVGAAGMTALGLLDTPNVKAKLAIVLDSLNKKGVFLGDESLLKKFVEIAPGGGSVALRQAGIVEDEFAAMTEKESEQ